MRTDCKNTAAYKLFIQELSKDVLLAKQHFLHQDMLSESKYRETRNIFHKIKGSAGFFGLAEVAAYAGDMERMLKKPLEELVCDMNLIRELLLKIEEFMSKEGLFDRGNEG